MRTLDLAKEQEPYLVELRRHFHMYPELPKQEFETSKKIREELTRLGIPFVPMCDNSVVATITGSKPGKTVLLRGDIDALPVLEENDLPYKSKNVGVMHACGHDMHITMLMGAAIVLNQMKDELCGSVKLVFQESEEYLRGARLLCEAGVMEGVDACFALHASIDSPVGKLEINHGFRSSCACGLHIEVTGKAGHSSLPQTGTDAILAGSAIVMNLQSIVSRNIDPNDFMVIHVGRFTGGQQENIIAAKANLDGSIRYYDPKYHEILPPLIQRVCEETAAAFGATVTVDCHIATDPVVNDDALTDLAQETAISLMGKDCIIHTKPMGGSEDYAFFLRHAPGSFAFIGACPKEGCDVSLHNGKVILDEGVLPLGAAMHAQFAVNYLSGK